MRQKLIPLALAGVLLFLYLFRVGQHSEQLRPGDIVTPRCDGPIQWTAGEAGQLAIRLSAKHADDTAWRRLGLDALPYDVSPVADVTFSANDQSLGQARVELSHRC